MPAVTRSAELELPSQFYGGDVRGLFASFGLFATHVGDDTWKVRAATTPNGKQGELVTARTLAGPRRRSSLFDVLPTVLDELPPFTLPPEVEKAKLRREDAAEKAPGDLITQLFYNQMRLKLADVEDCQGIAEQLFDFLGKCVHENSTAPVFPDRSVHVVTATGELYRRVRLPAIALRIDQDPSMLDELRAGKVRIPAAGQLFNTSSQQSASLVLNGAFMGPLWGCLLPHMWSLPCSRLMSTTVFGFGRTMPASLGGKESFLQLLPLPGLNPKPSEPSIRSAAVEEAIDWWVLRINQMFWYLTDPATYIDSNGRYLAHEQLHWMLTIDQVLRLTTSLQIVGFRDVGAQRVLAFTLLGSFADRLFDKRVTLKKLFTLSYARRQFDAVKGAMSPLAGEVLLPAAQRAIDALERLQKGFFIAEQRRASAVMIHLPGRETPHALNLEDAAARLMVVHRNATHGYGGLDDPENLENFQINERLLAHHNGDIPGDIALLPYLYLLLALIRPGEIRDRIINHVERK